MTSRRNHRIQQISFHGGTVEGGNDANESLVVDGDRESGSHDVSWGVPGSPAKLGLSCQGGGEATHLGGLFQFHQEFFLAPPRPPLNH